MYCTIQEAWPDIPFSHNISNSSNSVSHVHFENNINNNKTNNKNIDDDGKKRYSLSEKEYHDYQKFLHDQSNKNDNDIEHFVDNNHHKKIIKQNKKLKYQYDHDSDSEIEIIHNIDCENCIEHISKCRKCLKKLYMKYNCVGNRNNNIFNMLNKDQKEILSVVLAGILVIILLQLLMGKNN
jgi:hypothetical protein